MSGKVDSLFGQCKAFSIDDENVNPEVVKYLRNVRNEALTTSAISMNKMKNSAGESNVTRHDASMYDDQNAIPITNIPKDPTTTNETRETFTDVSSKKRRKLTNGGTLKDSLIPEKLIIFNQRMIPVMDWFQNLQSDIFNLPCNMDYNYDNNTLELLISHIQRLLNDKDKPEPNTGVKLHLSNLLKNWVPSEIINQTENNGYMIDDDWIQKLLIKLQCVKIPNIDFLKSVITGDYSNFEPHGYRSWNQFLLNNEPCKDMFNTIINDNNIWLLVKYMTQSWITEISERQNHNMKLWLIYTLVYLPSSIVANNTSTLRDLGKKCREIIIKHYYTSYPSDDIEKKTNEYEVYNPLVPLKKFIKLEFKQFTSKEIPDDATLLELTLYIIATKYGQNDLIQWDSQMI